MPPAKDGAIKHVMSGVNPQGCQVFSFKHPSATELQHDFLWRTTRDLPERGRIGIFNRSYYEEVLIVRVHPEILRGEGLPERRTTMTENLAAPLPLDRRSGEASASQRHAHREILPASFEGGATPAVSGADRRPGKELEIQPGRHRGAEILEGYMKAYEDCLRATSTDSALVCRAGRRQAEYTADRLPDHPGYVRKPSTVASENR